METSLHAFVGEIVEWLAAFLDDEASSVLGVKGELKSLLKTVDKIGAVVQDAERRRIQDETVKMWLGDIEADMYDAKSILDQIGYKGGRLLQDEPSSSTTPVGCDSPQLSCKMWLKQLKGVMSHAEDLVDPIKCRLPQDEPSLSTTLVLDELRRETSRLARENLEKEPRILELRNQCTIIRTTQLAAAQEKLTELEKQMEELMRSYAPASLLEKLHDAINTVEEESEALNMQFLEKEVDLPTFVEYKKLRNTYHRMALLHLAAKTTVC